MEHRFAIGDRVCRIQRGPGQRRAIYVVTRLVDTWGVPAMEIEPEVKGPFDKNRRKVVEKWWRPAD